MGKKKSAKEKAPKIKTMGDLARFVAFGDPKAGCKSIASCITCYDKWKGELNLVCFSPLAPIYGGSSIQFGRSADAIIVGNDWLKLCKNAGANATQSVVCLASNYDHSKPMVALALEIAAVMTKPKTEPLFKIDIDTYAEIANEIFFGNYAEILSEAKMWGFGVKKGAKLPKKKYKTRSEWRLELGFDVLIHPVNLEPCKDEEGKIMKFEGTWVGSELCLMKFRNGKGELFATSDFPELKAA